MLPPVEDPAPLIITVVLVQVTVPPAAEALGGVVFCVTTVVAVAVQAFVVFVTVNLNVPAPLTVAFRLFAPEVILPEPDILVH